MAVFIYELSGCTSANVAGVEGSLARISGCSIYRTAQGAYLLYVEANVPPDGQLQAFLAPIKVAAIPTVKVSRP